MCRLARKYKTHNKQFCINVCVKELQAHPGCSVPETNKCIDKKQKNFHNLLWLLCVLKDEKNKHFAIPG